MLVSSAQRRTGSLTEAGFGKEGGISYYRRFVALRHLLCGQSPHRLIIMCSLGVDTALDTDLKLSHQLEISRIRSNKRCPWQSSKLRPFWSHMLPKCNLCNSKIYLGAFVRVQIIAVVRPPQFSAKRSRITAQHVPRDRELKQVKLFIRALV